MEEKHLACEVTNQMDFDAEAEAGSTSACKEGLGICVQDVAYHTANPARHKR